MLFLALYRISWRIGLTAQQTYEWLQKLLQQFTDESPDADQAVPGKQRFFRKMLDFFFK